MPRMIDSELGKTRCSAPFLFTQAETDGPRKQNILTHIRKVQ